MNTCHGQWIDRSHATIMIVRTGDLLEIKYGNGRGSFIRAELDLYAPATNIDEGEVYSCNTGVLTRNGDIRWSDDVRRHQTVTTPAPPCQ